MDEHLSPDPHKESSWICPPDQSNLHFPFHCVDVALARSTTTSVPHRPAPQPAPTPPRIPLGLPKPSEVGLGLPSQNRRGEVHLMSPVPRVSRTSREIREVGNQALGVLCLE